MFLLGVLLRCRVGAGSWCIEIKALGHYGSLRLGSRVFSSSAGFVALLAGMSTGRTRPLEGWPSRRSGLDVEGARAIASPSALLDLSSNSPSAILRNPVVVLGNEGGRGMSGGNFRERR